VHLTRAPWKVVKKLAKILKDPFDTKHFESDSDAAAQQFENPSLVAGTLVGILGVAVGAFLWAAITLATGYQIGWMAIGVGLLVGIAVRVAGKGTTQVFGCVGATLSLLGCLLGNLLTLCIVATTEELGLLDVLSVLTPKLALEAMIESFHPLDLLFYVLAIYAGYRISIGETLNDEEPPGLL
jgi:hypothetical protein